MSGTAKDSSGQTLPFTMPAGSAFQVLSYHAAVTCAVIRGHNARFGFTIPMGEPAGLAGLPIVVKVHDGGMPGWTADTYAHGVATSWCNGPSPSTRSPAATSWLAGEPTSSAVRPLLAEGPLSRGVSSSGAAAARCPPDPDRTARRQPPEAGALSPVIRSAGQWPAGRRCRHGILCLKVPPPEPDPPPRPRHPWELPDNEFAGLPAEDPESPSATSKKRNKQQHGNRNSEVV